MCDGMCRYYPGLSLPLWRCLICSEQLPSWESIRAFLSLRRTQEICLTQVLQAQRDGPAARTLAVSTLKSVLAIDTAEKRLAKRAGVLRPFLALVAMGIDERSRIGNLLDVDVLASSYRQACNAKSAGCADDGDPHAAAHKEAWQLLSSPSTGIQARSAEFYQYSGWDATWDETLLGVIDTIFNVSRKSNLSHEQSLQRCWLPTDARCRQLEQELLEKMWRRQVWVQRAAEASAVESEPSFVPITDGSASSNLPVPVSAAGGLTGAVVLSSVGAHALCCGVATATAATASSMATVTTASSVATASMATATASGATAASSVAGMAGMAGMSGMDAGAVSSAAGAAGASTAAATAGSVLLAGTVVLGVLAAMKLLWDVLTIAFGPSFDRLLPAVYTIATNLEYLETLGSLAIYDENSLENESLLVEIRSALLEAECDSGSAIDDGSADRSADERGRDLTVGGDTGLSDGQADTRTVGVALGSVVSELSFGVATTATHGAAAGDDKDLCKICLDLEANILLLPCKHLCACSSCGAALTSCPICRTPIAERMRIYK